MKLQPYCQYLNDFLDGDLDEGLQRDFVGHLKECQECHTAIEQTQEIERLLMGAWKHLELEPVESNIYSTPRPPSLEHAGGVPLRLGILAVLAATILITVAASLFWRTDQNGITKNEPSRQSTPNVSNDPPTDETPTESIAEYRTSYATAVFRGVSESNKIETNPQFTVYQVMPKVTFKNTN